MDTTTMPTTATTVLEPRCPSGEMAARGDGPAYLSLRGSYERATAGDLEDGVPRLLGPATQAIPEELMVGLAYTGCSYLTGDSGFEEMAWSNGLGLLLISWHEWPKVDDPSVMPFGGTAAQAGIVEVSHIESGSEESRLHIVRLFDGIRLVSVSSYGLTTMSSERVEEVAWAVYDGLPVDMAGTPETSPTVDELLDSLRSDERTVGEAEASTELSAFSLNLGAAHTSYTAVIDGRGVSLYDFGVPEVAERVLSAVSADGYSIAHMPHDWSGPPYFWRIGRLIMLYEGADEEFLEFVIGELGPPQAGMVEE